jgi:histidinol dehydrogenase
VEDILKQILNELKGLKTDVGELKVGQARLEAGQKKLEKNLIESLGTYTEKITEHHDDKTEVLNKRVFRVESEIERLSRQ